ncbi:hypothetical protein J2T57_003138 [Natronocella acetinitrilica]|uniref:DUF2219 family protein n=1 Tax=Natronocella acetinitrilica TaxID=414046 RepID=A0AAE3G6F7_9GAMM|nr:lipid A deacylase LpxR family protein [Natronocella acetinitrilica]MCP1675983.1 hypothetical protein [Natronocella acetinitrilica]
MRRWLMLLCCALSPTLLQAAPGSLVLEYENDIFAGEDSWYTNGFRASWITEAPAWVHALLHGLGGEAGLVDPDATLSHGYSIGQSLYTPQDISLQDPPLTDRPYAGWLSLSTGIGETRNRSLRRLLLTVGVVGPASQGERVQREVHRLINARKPQGWDTQLPNEPTLMLSYERVYRLWTAESAGGWGVDLAAHAGIAIGTPFTLAGTGATLRMGRHMPNDYSPPRIQPAFPGSLLYGPAKRWGWYVFAGVDGQAKRYDLFLDGTLFRGSRSVEREPLVGEFLVGIAFANQRIRISQTYTSRSREFVGQTSSEDYGAISLTVRW